MTVYTPVATPVIRALAEAARLGETDIARRSLELLGVTLTTAIGDAKDTRAARGWTEGRHCQRASALRAGLLAAVAISTNYGEESARSWFVSANPTLEWKSPLVFVRNATMQEEFDRLVQVAAEDAS